MALIECPECSNQVSSHAASCPKCGCPIKSPQRAHAKSTTKSSSTGAAWVIIAVFTLLAIAFFSTADLPPKALSANQPQSGISEGGEFIIPSDSHATYEQIDTGTLGDLMTLTTKRVGPSGTTYSKRAFDCQAGTTKYIGTGDTIQQMEASSPEREMSPVTEGSIAYWLWVRACS